ncbi:MAG TPA: glycerophosphodiester phosphodiesterase family protein [Mycobacteriales bacterium]|nr:glycerophosphodiester phosphodiesterase family protein [Mycobacteriales bacterium]
MTRGTWRATLPLLLLLGAVALPAPASGQAVPGAGDAVVSAHRGGAAYAPENTMAAFENAVRLGVDELEADVQLTADGELVLLHDDTLDRTTDCTGAVLDRTWAEVSACDAAHWWSPGPSTTVRDVDADHPLRGTGVGVPRLAELLALASAPGAPRASIELKNIPGEANFDPGGTVVATAFVAAVRASGVPKEQVLVQSFFPTSLEAVRRLDPELRTQFLTSSGTGQTAAQNLAYTVARDHDVMAPNDTAPDLTAELVAAAHAAGKLVVPYTPNTPTRMQAALDKGVDGLITDRPACLLQLLGRPVPDEVALADGVALCETEREGEGPTDRPAPETCEAIRPPRWAPTTGPSDSRGDLRVVGLQYKQDVENVVSYDTFRTAMRCLVEDHVVPRMDGRPVLAVFNEDIGLMTVATGSRGRTVREQAATPLRAPVGDDVPLGVAAALGQLNVTYAEQIAAYQQRFGPVDPRKQVLLAATDTFARAFNTTFSDIARDYGLFVVAGNSQARYRATTDPAEVALFADPDLPDPTEAYVAVDQRVPNAAYVWGPDDVDPTAPRGARNLLHRNEKVPLTQLEIDLLALDPGPSTGPEAVANVTGPDIASHRLGIATSLPAFVYGYPFGERPEDFAPCEDLAQTYMSCMDAQGVDVVVQDEANPGRWAAYNPGGWQPLEWMSSTWRAVADPTVGFRYNVTPHMVGNLLDIPFDGQSAITARAAGLPPATYVGNTEPLDPRDPPEYGVYAGPKPHFLALADWVVPDAPRPELEQVAAALAPGSGDLREDGYLQTAVAADLLPTQRAEPDTGPAPGGSDPVAAPVGQRLPATGGAALLPAAAALLLCAAVLRRRVRPT